MAIACKIVVGAYTLYPELPVGRRAQPIGVDLPTASGKRRFARRSRKVDMTLSLRRATEAEYTTWVSAFEAAEENAVVVTDETGQARTMRATGLDYPLVRTEPAVEGGLNTTGPGYFDLTLELSEI